MPCQNTLRHSPTEGINIPILHTCPAHFADSEKTRSIGKELNTQEELEIAFEEYQNGTFIKHWYVTVVGGLSADLKSNQVGVNMEALLKRHLDSKYSFL